MRKGDIVEMTTPQERGRMVTQAGRRGGRGIRRADGPSKTERAYASDVLAPLKLAGKIIDYWHDPLKLRLAAKTYYTPDYMVLLEDLAIEMIDVKGRKGDGPWVEDDAAVKIKVAAQLYPFVFALVWPSRGGGWSRRTIGCGDGKE